MRFTKRKRVAFSVFLVLLTFYLVGLMAIFPFIYGLSDAEPIQHSVASYIFWEVIFLTLTVSVAIYAVKSLKKIKSTR